MKNQIILFLIFCSGLSATCFSQVLPHVCHTAHDQYSSPEMLSADCGEHENYQPYPEFDPPLSPHHYQDARPVMNLNVNIHFIQRPGGVGNFTETVPAGSHPNMITGTKFAEDVIELANDFFLENNRKMDYPPNINPPVPDELGIRLELTLKPNPNDQNTTGVYFWEAPSDEHHYYCAETIPNSPPCTITPNTDWNHFQVYKNNYTTQQNGVINIYFLEYADANYIGGGGVAEGLRRGDQVKMVNSWRIWNINMNAGNSLWTVKARTAGLLLHEIGHLIGLWHPSIQEGGPDTCDDTPSNGAWGYGNNVMDYNAHNHAWTPCQLGIVHEYLTNELPHYVESDDYCILDNSKTISIQSGDDILWNASRYLNQNVIVESGAKLTITCKIGMSKNSKIIVKPGGKLIVDGGWITNICDGDFWKGIEVEGVKTQHQYSFGPGDYHQGYLELKNGAIVEHARDGVWLSDGGIVIATDAEFINNRRSVAYFQYENFDPANGNRRDNIGFFENCNFYVNDDYKGDSDFQAHVTMWDVTGVKFRDSDFSNHSSLNGPLQGGPNRLGAGIYTIDADFVVYPGCTFHNFHKGIGATSSSNNKTFEVRSAKFTNNWTGIYTENVNQFICVDSEFTIGANYLSDNANKYGIYTQGSHGFKVHENKFIGAPSNEQIHGIGIRTDYSGSSTTRIYRNDFIGLNKRGAMAYGHNFDHWYETFTGLDYFCNDFSKGSPIPIDIISIEDGNNLIDFMSGIRTYQGSHVSSAGNCFSEYPSQAEDDLFNVNQVNDFTYFYDHTAYCKEPKEWTPNWVFVHNSHEPNSCPQSELVDHDGFQDKDREELVKLADQSLEDYESIYREISEMPSKEAENIKIEAGNKYTDAILASEEILRDINEDKEGYSEEEVISTLSKIKTFEFQYALLKEYLYQDKIEEARSQLDLISSNFYKEEAGHKIHHVIRINELLIKLKEQGRNIAQCTEQEIALLHEVAQSGLSKAPAEARGILNFFYDGDYIVKPIELPESPVNAQEILPDVGFVVSPNPTSNILRVETERRAEYVVTLTDLFGRTVYEQKSEFDQTEIKVETYPAGTYLLVLSNVKTGEKQIQKIIITK